MISMKFCNFVVCIAGLAMGGCMMGASSRFPMDMTEQGPGPGFWPFLLGLALVVAAAALAVYTLFHRQELAEERIALGTAANRQVYVVMGTVSYFVSDKPQMAVIYTTEDGKSQPVLVENYTRTTWQQGQYYRIYADAYGTYDNMPWLCARYTYTY